MICCKEIWKACALSLINCCSFSKSCIMMMLLLRDRLVPSVPVEILHFLEQEVVGSNDLTFNQGSVEEVTWTLQREEVVPMMVKL